MDIKHGSFNLKWLTVTLIKDVNDEGFRGSKSSILVTTKAEKMNREAAKTSSDDTDLLWEGVAIPGTPPSPPPMAGRLMQGSCRGNSGDNGPMWKSLH